MGTSESRFTCCVRSCQVAVKVTLLNFMITQAGMLQPRHGLSVASAAGVCKCWGLLASSPQVGLQDQLLNIVVEKASTGPVKLRAVCGSFWFGMSPANSPKKAESKRHVPHCKASTEEEAAVSMKFLSYCCQALVNQQTTFRDPYISKCLTYTDMCFILNTWVLFTLRCGSSLRSVRTWRRRRPAWWWKAPPRKERGESFGRIIAHAIHLVLEFFGKLYKCVTIDPMIS